MSQTRIEENLKWCVEKLVDAELNVFTNEYGSEFDNRCLVHRNVINRTLDCLSEMRAEIERKDLALGHLLMVINHIESARMVGRPEPWFSQSVIEEAKLALEDKP